MLEEIQLQQVLPQEIEKHKDDTSEEGQEKLKKAQQKLAEFEKQLEALND